MSIRVVEGWLPGALGRIVQMHGAYYGHVWGLGASFEAEVATELGEFVRAPSSLRYLWLATRDPADGRPDACDPSVVGAIALDGDRLRWFITDPCAQGHGIGTRLLDTALEHAARHDSGPLYLWTFEGLDSARQLYERHGFVMTESRRSNRWGESLVERRFDRPAPAVTAVP